MSEQTTPMPKTPDTPKGHYRVYKEISKKYELVEIHFVDGTTTQAKIKILYADGMDIQENDKTELSYVSYNGIIRCNRLKGKQEE